MAAERGQGQMTRVLMMVAFRVGLLAVWPTYDVIARSSSGKRPLWGTAGLAPDTVPRHADAPGLHVSEHATGIAEPNHGAVLRAQRRSHLVRDCWPAPDRECRVVGFVQRHQRLAVVRGHERATDAGFTHVSGLQPIAGADESLVGVESERVARQDAE